MADHPPSLWGWLFVAAGLVLVLLVAGVAGYSLMESLAERRRLARQAAVQKLVQAARREARRKARAAQCPGTPDRHHRFRGEVCLACGQSRETSHP